jgi:small neutral amino acid transporter SnatA (MarC family)
VNLRRLDDTDLKQQFVILSLLLRELKKGETFASLLNIHDGDIRVVPTHLVCFSAMHAALRSKSKYFLARRTITSKYSMR